MGLSQSDRLSLLALIVAIIALIISSWQLAQQLFATATDGKRFCQGSIMGIWARKTRLSWRWSQIRFEAKYTTPDITLSSLADEELLRKGPTVPLHPGTVRKRRLMYRIPILRTFTEIFNGPASDFEGFFDICAANGDEPWELRQTRIPSLSITTKSITEKLSSLVIKLWHSSYEKDGPDVVTWPVLIRSIYENQLQATAVASLAASTPKASKEDHLEKGISEEQLHHPANEARADDRVVINLVERSWDLLPPDVVRPLAKSTIGAIVVIAHRLGMQWYDFKPNEGQMKAGGYGHEISSETIRGLGVVLQYTYRSESRRVKGPTAIRSLSKEWEHFAPTQAGDKLHCGIIPVDRSATNLLRGKLLDDIQLINAASKTNLEGLYDALGLQRSVCKDIDESLVGNDEGAGGGPGRHFRFAIEDAIAMLCPILSKLNSDARFIMWPLRNRFQPFTPLRQYVGVCELRDKLRASLHDGKKLRELFENRAGTVLEPMLRSPMEYLDEILDAVTENYGSNKGPKIRNMYLPTSDPRLATVVRIHHETSEVLKLVEARVGIPIDDDQSQESVRPFLLDLVGAHVTMAIRHGAAANKTPANPSDDDEAQADTFAARRMRVVRKLAELFADDIDSGGARVVGKNFRHRGYTRDQLEPLEITALWWVAVLRGICWWMTVRLKLPETNGIPSYSYYSQMPVYIT